MAEAVPPPDRTLWLALFVAAGVQLAQAFALPLFMSWDSYLYVDHADAILSPRFVTEFDFMRTPLFPLMLKGTFALLGRSGFSVVWLNTALCFAGAALIGLALRNWGHPRVAAIAALVLSALPSLIVYEHCALSEVGSFFFLALLVYVLSRPEPLGRAAVLAALALAVGYYFRPTLKFLGPVAAAYLALRLYWQSGASAVWPVGRAARVRTLGLLLLVAAGPSVAAWPWASIASAQSRLRGQYLLGLTKQMVLPPDAPELAEFRATYEEGIAHSVQGGEQCLTGLQGGADYAVMGFLDGKYNAVGDRFFAKAVARYPGRYLPAFARTFAVMLGFHSCESDTGAFVRGLGDPNQTGTRTLGAPPLLAHLLGEMRSVEAPNALGRVVLWSFAASQRVLLVSNLLLVLLLALGLKWREPALLALSALPLAFYAMHALVLMSYDRLAVPAHPLALACAIAGVGIVWNRARRRAAQG